MSSIANIFSSADTKWPDLRWVTVDDVITKCKNSYVKGSSEFPMIVDNKKNEVAFLQYTSGST